MLIAARNKVHNQKFKAQLKREFDMKDLRKAKKILGVHAYFGNFRRTTFSKC